MGEQVAFRLGYHEHPGTTAHNPFHVLLGNAEVRHDSTGPCSPQGHPGG